jgi:polyhydroxybutyrate depolymerase
MRHWISILFILLLCGNVLFGAEPPAKDAPPATKPTALTPGDHTCHMKIGDLKRDYLVHVPPGYEAKNPTPVVLALHGAAMSGSMMPAFSGLSKKSDTAGFIVVYPSGAGPGPILTWNAGGFTGKLAEGRADDVTYLGKLLDDLETRANVDKKRVFACGMSNGGMMCYRLAAELSDRIAAIAPVAGTIAISESHPRQPVPVLHIHGSQDKIVPFAIEKGKVPLFIRFKGVEESIQTWVKLDGCDEKPKAEVLSKPGDDMPVNRQTYSRGKADSEVVLIVVEGGGHTWPGQEPPVRFIGKSTLDFSANDAIWEFFQKHPRK